MYTIRGFSYSDLVTSGLDSNYFKLSVLVSVDTSLDRSFFDDVLIFEAAQTVCQYYVIYSGLSYHFLTQLIFLGVKNSTHIYKQ